MTEALARIRLLLMDVDGVLTDGRLFHFPDAAGGVIETKGFDSQDGLGLHWMHALGYRTGVISGRSSAAVIERARQLRMDYVYQGHLEKVPILDEILQRSGAAKEEVAYIGDDLTDIAVMNRVGFAAAVANARPEVKRAAQYVTQASGGRGAVREVVELILRAQGRWDEIQRRYEIG